MRDTTDIFTLSITCSITGFGAPASDTSRSFSHAWRHLYGTGAARFARTPMHGSQRARQHISRRKGRADFKLIPKAYFADAGRAIRGT